MKNQYLDIYGSKLHYLEAGTGDPILFLHGVPTSSYVWRNIIPYIEPLGRCIAVDLIGMGKSAKPDIEYSLFDHIKYIEKFIETLALKHITLIMHGWGSVIGLNYAMNHETNCRGLVCYESYLRKFTRNEMSLPYLEQISLLQNQENISDLILNSTYFVDKILPQGIMQSLPEMDMQEYRSPFLGEGAGRALNQYIKEMPTGGQATRIDNLINDYSKKLIKSKLPKLMLYSIPGFITTMATASWARDNLPNLELIDIGEELHFAQESNPALMGEAISVWLQGLES